MSHALILVDYSTENEHRAGKIIWGIAKRLVETTLQQAGFTGGYEFMRAYPEPCIINEPPSAAKFRPYVQALQDKIQEMKPSKILCLGAISLSMVKGATKALPLTKHRGRAFNVQGVYCLPTFNPYSVLKDTDLFRDFCQDIQKFVKEDKLTAQPKVQLLIPKTMDELHTLLVLMSHYREVACDLETEGFNPVKDAIISVGIGTIRENGEARVLIVPRELIAQSLTRVLLHTFFSKYEGTVVFHNSKFDLKFLLQYCGQFQVTLADTLLMHYSLDERPIGRYASHSLKTLAQTRYDAPDYAINFDQFLALPDEERDYQHLYEYQSLDVYYTIRLYHDLKAEMVEEKSRVAELCDRILFPGARTFADVELRGVLLDKGYLEEKRDVYRTAIRELEQSLKDRAGDPEFNPLSPAQVSKMLLRLKLVLPKSASIRADHHNFLQDEDDEGPGTRKDAMMQLAQQLGLESEAGCFVKDIVELRKLVKMNNTYFEGLLEGTDADGRIRTEVRLAGTATGRLSSANPNLQNIPARVGALVRDAFIAGEGNGLLQCDYSQLELRMLAYLSQDPDMCRVFSEGADIHRLVASNIFKKPPAEISKHERFLAKSIVFGIVYGRGAKTLVEGNEMDFYVAQGGKRITIEEAQSFINSFLGQFPKMHAWIRQQQFETLRQHFVETIFGRRRRFPLILDDNNMKAAIKRQAVNTPIQSAASDMCLAALIRIHQRLPKGAYVCFSVHDSILVEYPLELQREVMEIVHYEMSLNHGLENRLPFDVSHEVGLRWGSLKEMEFSLHAVA